jgi:hypothetical protein
MMINDRSKPLTALVMCLAATACVPTQSAAFRQMTAADHERAAQSAQDTTGGTAAEHLGAAQGLRVAEQNACSEVPESERDLVAFLRRGRIVSVDEVRDDVVPKPLAPRQPLGIVVSIRATPGVTEQWIGRVIQCHVAHHAVVGTSAPQMASPLPTNGVNISVSSTGVGFRVSITSPNIDIARRLVQEGRRLMANAS